MTLYLWGYSVLVQWPLCFTGPRASNVRPPVKIVRLPPCAHCGKGSRARMQARRGGPWYCVPCYKRQHAYGGFA